VALGGRQVDACKGEKNACVPPVFERKASVPTADIYRVDPLVARSRHADLVESAVAAESPVQTDREVVLSWRRCIGDYRVDPRSSATPHIITQTELNLYKEPVSDVLLHAREEIDRLYAIVRQEDYVVLLCNREGVAIQHRGDETKAEEYKHWGIWLGGVWSEQVEGTNGIGTAIVEQRSVLVHCGQHFRTRHANLSCAGAPIFDADNKLIAVLDASRIDLERSDRTPGLVLAAVTASVRAIEERLFRHSFRRAWTIAAAPPQTSGSGLLLAVDDDQRVVGADGVAREALGLDEKYLLSGKSLSAFFHYDRSLFRRGDEQDSSAQWRRVDSDSAWNVLITPPLRASKELRNSEYAMIHSRPRLSTLENLSAETIPTPSRGGLSPAVTRRVCDHIEGHFDEKIRLDRLAALAGLSTDHFARAFHQSVGVPPHSYLLRRRLEHVEHMLRETHAPLSEIALATGFADQSHLARHFRRWSGVSPRQVRCKGRDPIPHKVTL
jgi:transcriptional regulator of acetoin/glycerol metabolism